VQNLTFGGGRSIIIGVNWRAGDNMRILIADPDPSSRKAFGVLLKRRLKVCEILEADDMEALIQILVDSTPDLLLLDWAVYCSPAPETSLLLRKAYPEMKIILFSVNPDDATKARAVGAEFVHKGGSPDHLLSVLEAFFPAEATS
jgi:DNA-binding NarL/FixJ family response regulator